MYNVYHGNRLIAAGLSYRAAQRMCDKNPHYRYVYIGE